MRRMNNSPMVRTPDWNKIQCARVIWEYFLKTQQKYSDWA